MRYVVVYFSRYGNGKRLVERLAAKLRERGEVQVLTLATADPSALPPADVYVFSAPAEGFSLLRNMKRFMKEMPIIEGKRYGIINTHASRKSRLPKMEELLGAKRMVKAAELDIRVVGDYRGGNGLPQGWEENLDEFAAKI